MHGYTRVLAALALVALLAAPLHPAQAQGGYIGAGFGWTKADLGPIEDAADEVDDESMALRLIAGYRPFRAFAVELFYTDLGALTATTGTTVARVDATGEGVAGLVFLPLGKHADFFAKVGAFHWDAEATSANAGVVTASGRRKDTEPVYGVGVYLTQIPAVGVRFEYERYSNLGGDAAGLDDLDVDLFSVNLIYTF